MLMSCLLFFDGLIWSTAYLMIIRRGYIDRSYGMPVLAVCLNISWECIFAFIYPHDKPQLFINYFWFFIDIVILSQLFKYLPLELSQYKKKYVWGFLLVCVISAVTVEWCFTIVLDHCHSGMVLAYLQNLLMSILFVSMLNHRNSIRGQSIYIAVLKMLGTLSISIGILIYNSGPTKLLLICLSVWVFIFDMIYLICLYHKCIQTSVNPWKRL